MEQNVRELEAFSAVVYSSNFDLELLGAKDQTAAPARESDLVDAEPLSSSFSQVLVENETEPEVIEIKDSRKDEAGEPSSNEASADSAFDDAWNKANNGNSSAEESRTTQ
jgi:peroxin-3